MAPKRSSSARKSYGSHRTLAYNQKSVDAEKSILLHNSSNGSTAFMSDTAIKRYFKQSNYPDPALLQRMLAICGTARSIIARRKVQIGNLKYSLMLMESLYPSNLVDTYAKVMEKHETAMQFPHMQKIKECIDKIGEEQSTYHKIKILRSAVLAHTPSAASKEADWDKQMCNICHLNFEDDEIVYRHTKGCSGIFHKDCMHAMVEMTKTDKHFMLCPACYRNADTCIAMVYSESDAKTLQPPTSPSSAIFDQDKVDQSVKPQCSTCAIDLELKRNRMGSFFWGCPNYNSKRCKSAAAAVRKNTTESDEE